MSAATDKGMAWLASAQNPDGSWGSSHPVASTGLALLKFETHAINIGKSPFDDQYEYSPAIKKGLDYLFLNALFTRISPQLHGDPDTNGNELGIYFNDPESPIYSTSIALMAIVATSSPDRIVVVVGSPVNGWTYKAVAQDIVDYLAWAQTDSGNGRGGWDYLPNSGERSDNSISGWATFGLDFAEEPFYNFNCVIPAFVKSELNFWIDYIQNDVNGDTDDGGSGYDGPDYWVNLLKTGNLLQQMAFYGDTKETQRVKDAVDYIVRHWADPNNDPGWRGNPASYQATLALMKGLDALGITTIGPGNIDWFDDISTVLLAQQNADGSWPISLWDEDPPILSTEWALLTLQRVAPTPPPKPCDCCCTAPSCGIRQGSEDCTNNISYKNIIRIPTIFAPPAPSDLHLKISIVPCLQALIEPCTIEQDLTFTDPCQKTHIIRNFKIKIKKVRVVGCIQYNLSAEHTISTTPIPEEDRAASSIFATTCVDRVIEFVDDCNIESAIVSVDYTPPQLESLEQYGQDSYAKVFGTFTLNVVYP